MTKVKKARVCNISIYLSISLKFKMASGITVFFPKLPAYTTTYFIDMSINNNNNNTYVKMTTVLTNYSFRLSCTL